MDPGWMWEFKESSQQNMEPLESDHGGLEHPETTSGRKFGTQSKRTIILVGKVKLRPPPHLVLGLCLSGGITSYFQKPFCHDIVAHCHQRWHLDRPGWSSLWAKSCVRLPQVEIAMTRSQSWRSDQIQILPLSPGSQPCWSPARQPHPSQTMQESLWNTTASSWACSPCPHGVISKSITFQWLWDLLITCDEALPLLELDGLCWRFIGLSFHASRVINNMKWALQY